MQLRERADDRQADAEPLSSTRTITSSFVPPAPTRTQPPASVCFDALPTRLLMICSRRVGSPCTQSGSSGTTICGQLLSCSAVEQNSPQQLKAQGLNSSLDKSFLPTPVAYSLFDDVQEWFRKRSEAKEVAEAEPA